MIRVFDFDNTIFRGDSTVRFCLYSVKKRPKLLFKLPRLAIAFAAMTIGAVTKTKAKQTLFKALVSGYDKVDADVNDFWDSELCRIKGWYSSMASRDDVVISASPEFLLKVPAKRLGFRLIASRVDEKTGEYTGLNCHGEEKVRRYAEQKLDPDFEFYSDSHSDDPMARMAKKAFFVDGDVVSPWTFENSGSEKRRRS